MAPEETTIAKKRVTRQSGYNVTLDQFGWRFKIKGEIDTFECVIGDLFKTR